MTDERHPHEARIMELELRSEERRQEILQLQAFIGAYEARVLRLEQQIGDLGDRLKNPSEAMPSAEDDRPPHY